MAGPGIPLAQESAFLDCAIVCEILSHIPVGSKISNLEEQLLRIASGENQDSFFNAYFLINRYRYSPKLHITLQDLRLGGALINSGLNLQNENTTNGIHAFARISASCLTDEQRQYLANLASKLDYTQVCVA